MQRQVSNDSVHRVERPYGQTPLHFTFLLAKPYFQLSGPGSGKGERMMSTRVEAGETTKAVKMPNRAVKKPSTTRPAP